MAAPLAPYAAELNRAAQLTGYLISLPELPRIPFIILVMTVFYTRNHVWKEQGQLCDYYLLASECVRVYNQKKLNKKTFLFQYYYMLGISGLWLFKLGLFISQKKSKYK